MCSCLSTAGSGSYFNLAMIMLSSVACLCQSVHEYCVCVGLLSYVCVGLLSYVHLRLLPFSLFVVFCAPETNCNVCNVWGVASYVFEII